MNINNMLDRECKEWSQRYLIDWRKEWGYSMRP